MLLSMKEKVQKINSKKYWITVAISLIGMGIVVLYGICGEACAYLKGSILSLDLKYLGILYMGVVMVLAILKKRLPLLLLLSLGLGAEIYLTAFQIKNLVYCYYCVAFGATVLVLFLLNFDMSRKIIVAVCLVLGFVLFSIFFHGLVTPVYAEEILIPSFGYGETEVRLYTDYFCGPCRSVEERLETLVADLVKKKTITITFIDTPIHEQTKLYARYFLYILNEKKEFKRALRARAVLFEAAMKNIKDMQKLEEFLKEKKMTFKPFNVVPTFSVFSGYLKEDRINATPTCVIYERGQKKAYTGAENIMNALEELKQRASASP